MTLKARSFIVKKGAYVVQLSELCKLWALVEDRVGTVTSWAECSDGVQRAFNSWQDLRSYDNYSTKHIVELSLRAQSSDWGKSVSIEFSPRLEYKINIAIECPEDELPFFKDAILGTMEGMRHQVLSHLVGRDFLLGSAYMLMAYIVARILSYIVLHGVTIPPDDVSVDTLLLLNHLATTLIGMLFFIVVGYALYKLRARLLPPTYFALGQGESRYRNWKTRWQIALTAIGAVVSVISIVVGVVSIVA